MKVYRYMSLNELNKALSGIDIINPRKSFKARTNSSGICFLPEAVEFETVMYDPDSYAAEVRTFTYNPQQCYEFLYGIVSHEVLVEFETDISNLTRTYGVYDDPINDGLIEIAEYCTKMYNIENFIPLRYLIPESKVWYRFNR